MSSKNKTYQIAIPANPLETLLREIVSGGSPENDPNFDDDKEAIIKYLMRLREKEEYTFMTLWFKREFERDRIHIIDIMKHHGLEFAYEIFYILEEKSTFFNHVVFGRKEQWGNPALWFYKLGKNKMQELFLAIDEIYHRNFDTLWMMYPKNSEESFMDQILSISAPETGRMPDLMRCLEEFNVTEREFTYSKLDKKLLPSYPRSKYFIERVKASIRRREFVEYDQGHCYFVVGPKKRTTPLRNCHMTVYKDMEDAIDFMLEHRNKLKKCDCEEECLSKFPLDIQKKFLMSRTFRPNKPDLQSFDYPSADPKHEVVFEIYRMKIREE